MRPTQLNFRPPQERTAEYKAFLITHHGNDLNFLHKQKNASGSVLPKEKRFKDAPVFDKGTGQMCFLGPGSYNDHQSFIDLNKKSCPAKIVSEHSRQLSPPAPDAASAHEPALTLLTLLFAYLYRCRFPRCLPVSRASNATSWSATRSSMNQSGS